MCCIKLVGVGNQSFKQFLAPVLKGYGLILLDQHQAGLASFFDGQGEVVMAIVTIPIVGK
ncbi:hypothetical protein D3C77_813220 [compost metagenome]